MRLFLNVEKNNLLKIVFFSFLILPVQQGETSSTENSARIRPAETTQEKPEGTYQKPKTIRELIKLYEDPFRREQIKKDIMNLYRIFSREAVDLATEITIKVSPFSHSPNISIAKRGLLIIVILLEDLELLESHAKSINNINKVYSYRVKDQTFFEVALYTNKFSSLDWIIEKYGNIPFEKINPIMNQKINQLDRHQLMWLLSRGVSFTEQSFKKTITNFNFESADVLIQGFSQGLKVFDERELEDLFDFMVKQQSLEGIKWLLKKGANPRKQHLIDAIFKLNFEIANVLIDKPFSQGLKVFDERELEDLFGFMVKKQSLEGIGWLVNGGFKIQTSHFEQIVLNKEWKMTDWFEWFLNYDTFISYIESGALVSFMLDIEHIEGIKSLIDLQDIEITREMIENRLSKQSYELADFLVSQKPELLDQETLKQLFVIFLDKGQLGAVKWVLKQKPEQELEITTQYVSQTLSNESYELADFLVSQKPELLDQETLKQLFERFLDEGQLGAVKWVLKQKPEKGASHLSFKKASVRDLILSHEFEIVDLMLQQKLKISESDKEAWLDEAVLKNDLKSVSWLLERGAVLLEEHFDRALESEHSNEEFADFLISALENQESKKKQLEQKQTYAKIEKFIEAFDAEDSETISSLLKDTDFDINAIYEEHTLLTRAISSKNKKLKDFLLKQDRTDINRASADGTTPLMWAILAHDLEAVKSLGKRKDLVLWVSNPKQETAFSLADQVKDPSLKQKIKTSLQGIACRHSFELKS